MSSQLIILKSIYLFILKYLFIYLAVARELLVAACGIELPDQGSNPGPLHWERGVLATGPPGKSQVNMFNF